MVPGMPPDSYPTTYMAHMTNKEMMDVLKAAPPPQYEDNVKSMKTIKEEMQKYMATSPQYVNSPRQYISTWDKQFSEQSVFKDMEDRLSRDMQQALRRLEETHAFEMAKLEMHFSRHREATEQLVTALVEQNRELSRRVTELEWEGITP